MEYEVRVATVEDAMPLGAMHVASWREAYPHLLSDASFAKATPESRGERWREILGGPGNAQIWVACAGDRIIGFSSAGAPRDEGAPRPLELYSIYVLAEAQGTGLGQTLIDTAIGSAPASVWVAELNPRAQAFYRRNGFEPDGAHKVAPFILDEIAEIRMVR